MASLCTTCGPHTAKRQAEAKPISERSEDPSTLSEPCGSGRAYQTHLSFDLAIDFVARRLVGSVQITAKRGPASADACELVLDTQGQEINDVTLPGGEALKWAVADKHPELGAPLRIQLPGGEEGSEATVVVHYATLAPSADSDGCSALQWLPPQQTKGKKFPYLYSQCQAIHARALVPCQDTCSRKVTYEASVSTPAELVPLMSAVRVGEPEKCERPKRVSAEPVEGCSGDWAVQRFVQKVTVPSYLIAIVCGKLGNRRIGPRSLVWSEDEMLDACEAEFKDHTEKFLQAGEELCGPYEWGVYDLLVLPPSFSYGGMENPCLTFVTPTLLAGDQSQVSVIAHEIAHSWSGNLVTNHNWEHFWLNEGLTVFTELKIIQRVLGDESAVFTKQLRWSSCCESVRKFGHEHNFTRLVPDLSGGIDPDDAFSTIPYVKGWACFSHLETRAGGPSAFEPFIRNYIKKFRFVTATSEQLKAAYEEAFPAVAKEIDWDRLFYAPGDPPFKPDFDQAPLQAATKLAADVVAADKASDRQAKLAELSGVDGWPSLKTCAFLDVLDALDEPLHADTAKYLCEKFRLLDRDYEIRCRAITVSLAAGWEGAVPACEAMAAEVGRLKFARPLYKALKSFDRARADKLFSVARPAYHPITCKMIERDLTA
eukprot:TRINITY_DN666_c0_g1_i2.p1 TRINITY_DN666_c0_g1~~TRINITY_DN666_c0_g1_i2.p1  ORF type:complete len:682 (+),score=204.65 TRINITY_DN666_c0_g1_i2:81-2048(+)